MTEAEWVECSSITPPQFSLKISFMMRKNSDGTPDVVKTAYPVLCMLACMPAYPE